MAGLSAPSYGSASSAIACPASVSNSYHMSTIFAKPKCSDFVNKDGALHGRTTAECLESNVANDFGLGIDLDMKPHHIATLPRRKVSRCRSVCRCQREGNIQPELPPDLHPQTYLSYRASQHSEGASSLKIKQYMVSHTANAEGIASKHADSNRSVTYGQEPSRDTAWFAARPTGRKADG
jgi:hypothetical protein